MIAFLWAIGVLGGNVREVVAGRYYRSAQLTGATLEGAMRKYHIASVVNLRGSRRGDADYASERRVCERLASRHEDVALSAVRLPPPAELDRLLHAFDTMPRPLMVHCQGGSDRTGLASTLTSISTRACRSTRRKRINSPGDTATFPFSEPERWIASSICTERRVGTWA